jgi:hypothetical protein
MAPKKSANDEEREAQIDEIITRRTRQGISRRGYLFAGYPNGLSSRRVSIALSSHAVTLLASLAEPGRYMAVDSASGELLFGPLPAIPTLVSSRVQSALS